MKTLAFDFSRAYPLRPMVKCLACTREFGNRRTTAKFCSGECRIRFNADKRREAGIKARS